MTITTNFQGEEFVAENPKTITEFEFRRRFQKCLSRVDRMLSRHGLTGIDVIADYAREEEKIWVDKKDLESLRDHPLIKALCGIKHSNAPLSFDDYVLYGNAWEHFNQHQIQKVVDATKL